MALRRDLKPVLSTNEKTFIIKALREGQRIDGRSPLDVRPVRFEFSLDGSACTVLVGGTRVLTTVTALLEPPYPDRPNEGSLRFNVEFLPMAAPHFESGRPGEEATEVARLVERGLRESRAVDTEALVVLAGRKVWHLRVDIFVQDHQGNLADACGLSALAALMAFRRPDVTVGGDSGQAVTVHSPDVREPVPLSIHHLPLPITFALFEDGSLLAVDPSLREELAASGSFTVTQNPHGELCAVQKVHGVGLPPDQLLHCIRVAGAKVAELVSQLKSALESHEVARVQARVRRHKLGGGAGLSVDALLERQAAASSAAASRPVPAGAADLDLTALPESCRNLLRRAEEVLGDADDSSSSGSEAEDGDEGLGDEEEASSTSSEEEAANGAAQLAGTDTQRLPQAVLAEDMEEDDAAAQAPAVQQGGTRHSGAAGRAGGKKQRVGPAKPKVARQDEFEVIASLIANAGAAGKADGGLAAAVKPGAAGKKKKGKGQPQ